MTITLTSEQRKFIESDTRPRLCFGARQSGKSTALVRIAERLSRKPHLLVPTHARGRQISAKYQYRNGQNIEIHRSVNSIPLNHPVIIDEIFHITDLPNFSSDEIFHITDLPNFSRVNVVAATGTPMATTVNTITNIVELLDEIHLFDTKQLPDNDIKRMKKITVTEFGAFEQIDTPSGSQIIRTSNNQYYHIKNGCFRKIEHDTLLKAVLEEELTVNGKI